MMHAFFSKLLYQLSKSRRNSRTAQHTDAVEIRVDTAGTLQECLEGHSPLSIKALKISGNLNGADFKYLRELKNLSSLDLSESFIKRGGGAYFGTNVISEDNEVSSYLFYNLPVERLILPASATRLRAWAFGKSPFFRIEIPAQVASIATDCFTDCPALREVYIADSSEPLLLEREQSGEWRYWGPKTEFLYIGRNLKWSTYYTDDATPFSKMTLLKEVVIGGCASEVPDYSFYNCRALLNVTLEESVKVLGRGVFEHSSSLTCVTCTNSVPPEIQRNTFHPQAYREALLLVPHGSLKSYTSHPYWKKFQRISESEPAQ